jgi:hypothetical protein
VLGSIEKAEERRAEQRLQYRWPVRFVMDGQSKPFQGQIVDLSSNGIAFLCHSDQSSFETGQKLQVNFGVPHFGSNNLFDTVLFERTGLVRRIDKPSGQIFRIALQFANALFFRPGEQGISESETQQRLDTKNLSIIRSEETARVYNEALIQAQQQLRNYAQAKAKTEEKLKAEIEDRLKTEAKLRTESEEKIRFYAENIARLEEKLDAKEKELAKTAAIAEKAEEKAQLLESQLAQIKEYANQEISRIKKEAADLINQIKANEKNALNSSVKKELLKRLDSFFSDRNKIF